MTILQTAIDRLLRARSQQRAITLSKSEALVLLQEIETLKARLDGSSQAEHSTSKRYDALLSEWRDARERIVELEKEVSAIKANNLGLEAELDYAISWARIAFQNPVMVTKALRNIMLLKEDEDVGKTA